MGTIIEKLPLICAANEGMDPQLQLKSRASRAVLRFWQTVLVWQERVEQRHALETMEPHMFQDMGLSPAQVRAEIAKPFWRP